MGIGDRKASQQATATVHWEGEMLGNYIRVVRTGLGKKGEPRSILEVKASGP